MSLTGITFIILASIITAYYAVLIGRFAMGWKKLSYTGDPEGSRVTKVSLAVPFRNESGNLPSLLSCIAGLSYPPGLLEVILVDDHSTDDGKQVAEKWLKRNSFPFSIRLTDPGQDQGKKAALTTGINNATGDLVVTTDADCRFGPGWLQSLVSSYEISSPKMLWGPVAYEAGRGPASRFFLLEFMGLVASGAGAAGNGNPFLCNGANLAFEKKAFEEVGGYHGNESFASGDDVFLLHKFKRSFGASSLVFVKHEDAVVSTQAPAGLLSFLGQRLRWASKSRGYKDRQAVRVAVAVYLVNLALFLLALGIAFNPWMAIPFSALYIIKVVSDTRLLFRSARFFGKRINRIEILLFGLAYIPYVTLTGLLSVLFSYRWKGRSGVK